MNYSDFTGLYPLSKTLRFELRPIGKTKENIERNGILLFLRDKNKKITAAISFYILFCIFAPSSGRNPGSFNKRLLLFGILLNLPHSKNPIRRISRKRLCVLHGRDLSGLVGISGPLKHGKPSMLFCALMPAIRR